MNFNASGHIDRGDYNVYNFEGELPTDNFILGIVTPDYYDKYGNIFVNSAIKLGENVHMHIINPTSDNLPEEVTVTTSTHPNMTKNVFCPYRFVIIQEILSRVSCGLWMFDIDGEFVKSGLDYSSEGIGLFVRNKDDYMKDRTGWDRDWAGTYLAAFYIFPNDENRKCIQFFIDRVKERQLKWCLCQGTMYRLYQECKDEFNFFQVQDTTINIWPGDKDNYLFYHYGKGTDYKGDKVIVEGRGINYDGSF